MFVFEFAVRFGIQQAMVKTYYILYPLSKYLFIPKRIKSKVRWVGYTPHFREWAIMHAFVPPQNENGDNDSC